MFREFFRWFRHRWADDAIHQLPSGLLDRLANQIRAGETAHIGGIGACIEGALPNGYLLQQGNIRERVRQQVVDECLPACVSGTLSATMAF
jgi:hypothetical protein